MEIETIIGDSGNEPETIVISQQESSPGEQIYTAFLTVHDDGGTECTFHYNQLEDIIDALKRAEALWFDANRAQPFDDEDSGRRHER